MILRVAAFFLTVLAALATGLGATARAQGMVSGAEQGFEIVICAEGGTETIRVDAAGDPIPPAGEHCPCPCLDCLPAAETAVLPEAARSALPATSHASLRAAASNLLLPPARRARPEARGPPIKAPA